MSACFEKLRRTIGSNSQLQNELGWVDAILVYADAYHDDQEADVYGNVVDECLRRLSIINPFAMERISSILNVTKMKLDRGQNPLMSTEYDPEFFRPDGTMKTLEERQRFRAAQGLAKAHIQRNIAERTAKPQTHDEILISNHRQYAATLKAQLPSALREDRGLLKRKIAMFEAEAKKLEGKLAEESRQQKLSNHPAVRNAREHAQAFARTPPVGADPDAVAMAYAMVHSNDWDDPVECARDYFVAVSGIETEALNRAQSEALDKQAAAAKAEAEAARAQVAAVETRQRLEKAKEMVDA